MSLKSSTLRPGLLVCLKTSISGNVKYAKTILESERMVEETGAREAKWETTRVVLDPEEHDDARVARSKMTRLVTSVCARSAFGLLCPESDSDKLDAAIKEAREIADNFNAKADLSRIYFYVMTGRIAPDDVEAVKAINSEIRGLMEDMERGMRNLDVKVIREAASRAKEMGTMLSADAQARVQIAVEQARQAAKKIVQAGEQAAAEVDLSAIRKVTEMRTAFLDLDPAGEIAAPAAEQRSLDLAPSSTAPLSPKAPAAPAVELE